MCHFCSKFWKVLPDYERHIMSETNDNGYKVVTSTKLGELKNIKLAVSSTHWDSNKMMIFDWKFCPVCGDKLPEEKMLDNSRYVQYNEQVTELLKNANK